MTVCRRVRFPRVLGVAIAIAAVGLACAPPLETPAVDRVLLLGIDGLDWRILEPAMESGRVPNLARLRDRGAAGPLATLLPTYSPIVWASVATGRGPRAHGIDFFGARDATGIAARIGVELPVEPRMRCAFVFECREQIGITPHMILPNGVAFRSEGERYLAVVSPPPERDPATVAFDIDYALFDDIIWPTLAERVPAFAAIKLASAYSCHYDFNTLDGNVIVGHVPTVDNFLVAAGFSGHGLMQSPAVGRALSELIRFGEYRTLDLSRFGYERVLSHSPLRETNCY